jgi:hypothetical protein
MGDLPPAIANAPVGYQAGAGMIVSKLPDEIGVPLRRDEFDILREGGISEARASRDLCLGIFFGALVGIIGVIATIEWESVWKPERRGTFIFWVGALVVLASGSGVGAVIHEQRRRSTVGNSPYSRLVDRLKKLYDDQRDA